MAAPSSSPPQTGKPDACAPDAPATNTGAPLAPTPTASAAKLPAAAEQAHGAPKIANARDLAKVSLGALGVVYGDIGTSPLYALKECLNGEHGVAPTEANVLGLLSLVFWSLTLVIVFKYLSFIMRADNHGEGGILALLALLRGKGAAETGKSGTVLLMMGLFGAALLYGDGMITPAISVLSAVEGLEVATTTFQPVVIPITVGILVALFLAQKRGTAGIGAVFGPMMLVWFASIAVTGVVWIVRAPGVLVAVNPAHAIAFFAEHRMHGFLVLAAVVLCITGGEALYADMGHFGTKPIRAAWYAIVFPALLMNYFGQGAIVLLRADAARNPFFAMVQGWTLYPFVFIATVATVIASQALISGAFSLTQQAVQLGYWPRVSIVHTSGSAEGQIYIPEVNQSLMVACCALVLAFKKSTNLAAAYGIAVTGTMAITSILFFAVARARWKWSLLRAGSLTAVFLSFDLAFFLANATKIHDGGWFPIAIAVLVFTTMTTWKRGREALYVFLRGITLPLNLFMEDMARQKPMRVKGTAVFMTSNPDGAPPVLLHHFKHNKVLHEKVVLLAIATHHEPEVPGSERIQQIRDLGHGFHQVTAAYGFMQMPNVIEVLQRCAARGLVTDRNDTSFFLGRETLLITERPGMARWRKALFAFLSRNARPANAFFRIPPNRVVELGTQIEL
jgi:KUP system potassium uptake protein